MRERAWLEGARTCAEPSALPTTGDVEVVATKIDVITESATPPFPIEDRVDVEELIRLKYLYLDLRRPEMTRILRLRHQLISSIRRFFDERGFVHEPPT